MKTLGWLCLGFALLFSRRPERLVNPQFYAEDGSVFFCDAARHGASAVGLTFQGYLHAVPRLVAAAASGLPWEWLPSIYAFSAAAATLYVMWRVFSARIPRPVAVISSLALLAVPHSGEIWNSLCCLHFILAALLAVNLVEPAPVSEAESRRRGIEMGLVALTGPEIVVATPALLWRSWQFRHDRLGTRMMLLALPAAAIQLGVIAVHPRSLGLDFMDMIRTAFTAAIGYAQFLFAGAGIETSANSSPEELSGGLLVGVAAVIAMLILFADTRNRRRLPALILLGHAAAVLAIARIAAVHFHGMWPNPLAIGARYAYLPFVLVVWAIAWLFMGVVEQEQPRRSRICLVAAALLLIPLSAARHWMPRRAFDHRWAAQVQEARAGKRTVFHSPANPHFDVPPLPPTPDS